MDKNFGQKPPDGSHRNTKGDTPNCTHISLSKARSVLAETQASESAQKFAIMFERGNLKIELYAPVNNDFQTPHEQDEVYFVIDGTGIFEMGDERVSFASGDFLFVAAGVPHRFTQFGETLTTWVIFYGPVGGETL